VQNRLIRLFILLIFIPLFGYGQSESGTTYAFLNLPFSARSTALGNNFLSIYDNDLGLALNNPSLINSEMNNHIQFNFVDYFSDINYGSVSYGRNFNKLGSFVASMQYINYGQFTYATNTGEQLGSFTAGDYAATIGWGRALDTTFYIGANLKALYSAYETYNSLGLAVDIAATYWLQERKFSASIIFRNIGSQVKTYTPNTREPLPFEIQAALSKELAHLPLRFSVVFTHLQKWDLTYTSVLNSGTTDLTSDATSSSNTGVDSFADKLMRHIVLGAELRPMKNISIRLGYNYLQRKEMTIPTRLSTVGFSWGFGVNIYKFRIAYARNAQHLTASPNYISISTNLNEFIGK